MVFGALLKYRDDIEKIQGARASDHRKAGSGKRRAQMK
jgi:hypothetical protein